jgi:hypothetical protein
MPDDCRSRTKLTHNRAKYIEALENRLARMEKLLRLAGMLLIRFCRIQLKVTYTSPLPSRHPRE